MHWQNSVLYFKNQLKKKKKILSYTKLCNFCFFLSVSQVHYWDTIHTAQHSPNGSADPTILLHHCWWSDVFCYWSGVFLLTGKRSYIPLNNSQQFSALFYFRSLFYVSSRPPITWKQCCRQAGYWPLLSATSLCWLWLKLQSFPNRWVSTCPCHISLTAHCQWSRQA